MHPTKFHVPTSKPPEVDLFLMSGENVILRKQPLNVQKKLKDLKGTENQQNTFKFPFNV
jgi:hypothetical protein